MEDDVNYFKKRKENERPYKLFEELGCGSNCTKSDGIFLHFVLLHIIPIVQRSIDVGRAIHY